MLITLHAARPLLIAVLAFHPLLLRAATLTGRVALPPATGTPLIERRYEIVSNGGTLASNPPLAIVYLEGTFPAAAPAAAPVAQIPQKDLRFQVTLLPIRTGTRVEFPNLDDTYHNIFSYSAPKRFDLGRYRRDEKPVPSQLFDQPGLVTLRCEIHEHMHALILVLDTPHFAVTDPEGNYILPNLPPGHYTLKAWVNSKETRSAPVDLAPDAALTVNFPRPP